MHRTIARLLAASIATGAVAQSDIIVVNTLEDIVDFGGNRRVGDLPGNDGRVSFREAVIAANNTPGGQRIHFAIPRDEWWLVDTIAVLKLENGVFIVRDDETTIDFTTQTDFTGDTNPDGNEVGIFGLEANGWGVAAIIIDADRCTVVGLDKVWQRGHAVQIAGSDNRVISCTISGPLHSGVYISGGWEAPSASRNIVGGTAPGEGNVLSAGGHGVRIDTPADDNIVIGNLLTGTFAGIAVRGNPYTGSPVGNRIGGTTPEERNVIAGAGRYGEEGFPDGAQVQIEMAINTIVEGNYIGTTPDGMGRPPQVGPTGVEIRDSENTIVRNNLIAGLVVQGRNHYQGQTFGQAIRANAVNRDNLGVVIEGNRIGVDATGQNPIPTLNGVVVSQFTARYTPRAVRVGGTEPGQGNLIRSVQRTGVLIGSLVPDTEISGNSISLSGLLGIDLVPRSGELGVTPNDPGDTDTDGGNELQNFPVLSLAEAAGGEVRVVGSLNSNAGRDYRVEFFASDACDGSGHGEGERYLGSTLVQTDASGDASFDIRLAATVAPGQAITSTATDLTKRATSEFSACVTAVGGCRADMDGNGRLDIRDFFAFQAAYAAGDLRADFDNNGVLDIRDFFAFQSAFAAGC